MPAGSYYSATDRANGAASHPRTHSTRPHATPQRPPSGNHTVQLSPVLHHADSPPCPAPAARPVQVDCSFTASYGNKELTVEDKTKPSPPPPPPRPAGPLPGQQALLQQAQQRAQPIVININNFNGAEGQAATTTTTRPVAAAGVPPLPPPAAAATANATAGAAAAGPAVGAIVPGGTITNTNGAASG